MPTTRDQLIADWHKRLATASEAPEEPTGRAAWLTRLRIRLYRFLLSLYGEGNWNAPADPLEHVRHGSPDPAAASTEGLPLDLAGKPAKDVASIRAVLHSVADARENRPQAGPLTAGADQDAWIVVASTSRGLDPEITAATLSSRGIVPRVIPHQRDVTVEVRACHLTAAEALIDSQRRRLAVRPRLQPIVSEREKAKTAQTRWSVLFFGVALAPVVGMLAAILLVLVDDNTAALTQVLALGVLVWAGSLSIIGLMYLFAGLRRKSRPRALR